MDLYFYLLTVVIVKLKLKCRIGWKKLNERLKDESSLESNTLYFVVISSKFFKSGCAVKVRL